ncbi:hypothetical protein M4D51_05890 [Microbacterium sp. p3-SID338]|uniref:site-2 protease family protein n=1 Tax=unclassified Microbacterium TaxID=2609290 RepID=UPI0011AF0849|nr:MULTISPECIES: site-2 protease family protein [unclassified Microbacterium]MCT1395252.1 hypothetical protein [Microbacterium sp. p3-SID338]
MSPCVELKDTSFCGRGDNIAGVEFWDSQSLIKLRPDVEQLPGADGRLLLKTEDARYIAVPVSAAALLDILVEGTTGRVIFHDLLDVSDEDVPRAHERLAQFLEALRQNKVLNIQPTEEGTAPQDRVLNRARADFFRRIPLSRQFGSQLAKLGARVRALPRGSRIVTASLLLAGLLSWAVWLLREGAFANASVLVVEPIVLVGAGAVIVATLWLHECAHAFAMGFNRLEVREMGLGLALYVVPVAYVDRGAVYALRSRAGRAAIALAGPLLDGVMILFAVTLAVVTQGWMSEVFSAVFIGQSYLLAINLNPLFRTDGYHALEAVLGATNMRSRAIAYVFSSMRRLPQPLYLRSVSPVVKAGYIAYLAAGVLYVGVLLAVTVFGVFWVVGAW